MLFRVYVVIRIPVVVRCFDDAEDIVVFIFCDFSEAQGRVFVFLAGGVVED
jgi:hypothetical protein